MAYAIGSAADGGIRYSDGTIKYPGSSATNSSYANYQPVNQTPVNKPYVPTSGGGTALGSATTYGGGTQQPTQSQPSGQENVDWYTNEFGQRTAIQPPQGPSQQEIDAQFNPILDVYNQAEGNLRGQLPSLISEAEAQAQASRGLLDNSRASSNELLDTQKNQARQSQQSQTAQQRQTLQELQTANTQRFGGASSAGQAASELQGREFQKNTFQIGQQEQQALQQIQQQKQIVEREYNQGLQQLEVNKQQAVNQIQRTFQDKLLEINARRGETESAKAQARMNALQELRNAAYQIDVSKAQFQQQLQLQAMENSKYLDTAAQRFLSAGSLQTAIPEPVNNVQTPVQAPEPELVGQISRRPDEELTGQVSSIPQFRQLNYGNPLASMFANTQPAF